MSVREIIQMLKDMGMEVEYTERRDGGVRITYINGTRFSGSTGNRVARAMVGATLSERRATQLKKIKTPKGKFGHPKKKKAEVLTEEDKKQIRRLQRKLRKNQAKGHGGTITFEQVRRVMREEGREATIEKLNRAERYAEGYVYLERVDALISRLQLDREKVKSKDQSKIDRILKILEEHRDTMREDDFEPIKDYLYAWEIGQINIDTLLSTLEHFPWK